MTRPSVWHTLGRALGVVAALPARAHHHCPPPWAAIPARRKRLTGTVR